MSNLTRAERRRQLRDGGYRRAPEKKGRRPALRAPRVMAIAQRSALVIGSSPLALPTPADIAKVNRGRRG